MACPARIPIESGGIAYPISHLNPPPLISGKRYTPGLCRMLVTIDNTNKKTAGPRSRAFSGNLPETTPKNIPFPKKMGTRMCPPYGFDRREGG